ncbi:MAG: DNA helicase RecQ [Candidatus Zixiibacteriota bacterium]
MEKRIAKAKDILRKTFGYRKFRPLQEEIIRAVVSRRDSLVIMPTGGGKSLCYQIPSLIFDGLAIIISPLISLMKDQVMQLREFGIQAVYLNSALSWDEYQRNMNDILYGNTKMLYVAPETLCLERTIDLLRQVKVSLFAIDEAHCISEWGHDFRPEYRQIVDVKKLFPETRTIALTATATPRVQEDIEKNLDLEKPQKFVASFDRKNLMLEVIPKRNAKAKLINFIRKFTNQSGIIYCATRKNVEKLSDLLVDEGFSALPYHAGLDNEIRHENQEKFIRDDVQIIVATIAFGMGINKPNVRFIVHYDLPKNLESYYQQIGRAGRDGMSAHCLLLYSYGDVRKIKYFIDDKVGREKEVAERHLRKMIDYAESYSCRRKPLLSYFGEEYVEESCEMCDNCNSEPKDMIDMTIPAQKFLSCVKRTGEIFGSNHIIDVLKGSEGKRVLELEHEKLSTYNIGSEYDRTQWRDLSRQFEKMELLHLNEHRGLELTQKAWKVLRGLEKVYAFLPEPRKSQKYRPKKAGKQRFEDIEYDEELFEVLRQHRKAIADEAGIPPYAVFPDRTFVEMAKVLPRTKAAMMRIHGVGKHKYRRYGNLFIDIITEYCDDKGIEQITG